MSLDLLVETAAKFRAYIFLFNKQLTDARAAEKFKRLHMRRTFLFFLIAFLPNMLIFSQQGKLPEIKSTSFKKDTVSIETFGAKADGITLNTQSINEAILNIHNKGGGVVVIPAGLWLTGP